MMYFVGKMEFVAGVVENYFTDDNKTFFYDEKKEKPLNKDDLECWALVLNSPWSALNLKYETKINKNFEKEGEEKTWQTTYSVVGYDSVYAEVVGYGKDELESLKNCKELFEYLQKKYNKEDECF